MSETKEEKFSFEAFQKITEEMKEKVINGTILNHMTIGIETFETIVKIVEHKNSQIAILEAALRTYADKSGWDNSRPPEFRDDQFHLNYGWLTAQTALKEAGLSNDKGGV